LRTAIHLLLTNLLTYLFTLDVALHPVLFVCVSAGRSRILPHIKTSLNFLCFCQWRNDGVAAASSDGGHWW